MVATTESQKAPETLIPHKFLWDLFLDKHSQFLIIDDAKRQLYARWERGAHILSNEGVLPNKTPYTYFVASQGEPGRWYQANVPTKECDCKDSRNYKDGAEPMAPSGWCKHLLASWIFEQLPRTQPEQETKKESTVPEETSPAVIPPHSYTEAPVSWNARYHAKGVDQQITIRGTSVDAVLADATRFISALVAARSQQEPAAAPAEQARPLPVCPTCGQADTLFIRWEAKPAQDGQKARQPGGAWKCRPCDKLFPRGSEAAPAA